MARLSLNFLNLSRRDLLVLAAAVLLSITVYVAAGAFMYRAGFPLDDAWIFQSYARNLAWSGEWSLVPGVISGGATAPLWVLLLAPGAWMGQPLVWALFLGAVLLFALSVLGEALVRRALPQYQPRLPWAGLALALEWHLVWAAASGMETLSYALLVTGVLGWLMVGGRRYLVFGLLTGLGVWLRPDALTLLAPLGLVAVLTETEQRARAANIIRLLLGFGAPFALYLLFNLWVSGTPFPNTFYAKQAEYAILQTMPLWQRYLNLFALPLIGVGAVWLPGVIGLATLSVQKKYWATLAALLWMLGYVGMYALQLPVTYQHGRYLMPIMPLFFLCGLMGMTLWIHSTLWKRYRWVIDLTWQGAAMAILVAFWVLGAVNYAEDVAVIESEMVDTAVWARQNLPQTALYAVHDIGAWSYYNPTALIDLAGLASPEVIPFIRDEAQLAAYLDQRGANYLVIFPNWYSTLYQNRPMLFITGAPFSPALGQTNMVIYQWNLP